SHQVWRYGKHQIFFFVNGRWVKDIELVKALIKGYNNVLSPGKFPAGVVMLDLDPHSIDVNVHPKKEEVRFTKPQVVSNAVIQAVQQTLKEHSALSTQIAPKGFDLQQQSEDICVSQAIDEKEGIAFIDQAKHVSSFSEDVSIEAEVTASGFVSSQENVIKRIIVDRPGIEFKEIKKSNLPPVFKTLGDVFVDRQVADDPVIEQQKAFTLEKEKTVFTFNGRIVGQILNTYIVVDRSEGMVLVDQHAAHERILYEQMKDRVVARESSLLLFPRILNLSAEELEALGRFDDILTDFGIQCGRMGPQSLAITAVPLGVAHIDLDELLRQVAAIILENDQVEREFIQKKLYEHVHSHLACKRAVKAGDTLTIEQIEKLLLDLTTVEKPYICIHGRPTHWLLEKSQLEKFFQR
ncbi:hypothetical protein FJ364_04535, partial [Candidatus Dependentiae bacterium]|nr:hypothetical protein [Candidatus Dependentiae bacterium]